jgi:nucleotide-binding universal stress UspA family protein
VCGAHPMASAICSPLAPFLWASMVRTCALLSGRGPGRRWRGYNALKLFAFYGLKEYQRRGPRAPELQAHLAMHGVPADMRLFKPIDNIVDAGLLAAVREFNCDLLAIGAYARSRLRQQILGGVT